MFTFPPPLYPLAPARGVRDGQRGRELIGEFLDLFIVENGSVASPTPPLVPRDFGTGRLFNSVSDAIIVVVLPLAGRGVGATSS
jgi:hypothetical protein